MAGDELLREIEGGSARISELVGAIKTYTHMDKAASRKSTCTRVEQHPDHARSQAEEGRRRGRPRLRERPPPRLRPRGELNQVWTNLLDNAIDAVDGQGRITVRTASENGRVLVEVSDDGPGIPEDVRRGSSSLSTPRRTLARARGSAWISPTALSSRTTRAISGSSPNPATPASRCGCR